MNPIRITAFVLLAAGALMLVLDVLERVVSDSWNGMALGYLWSRMAPGSLVAAERFIEGSISVLLWQQILLPFLMLPAWVACFLLGIILFFVGKRFED